MHLILLFFFPIGYLLTYQLFENYSAEYFLLSALLSLSFALMLLNLKNINYKNIIIFIIVIIFIFGYFIKFYYLSYYWDDVSQQANLNKIIGHIPMDIITIPKLFYVFEVISFSFILFSLASPIILRLRWVKPSDIDVSGEFINKTDRKIMLARKITYIALVIGIITTYLRYKYNLHHLTEVERLPYNLIGIINTLNIYVSMPLFGLAYLIGLSSGKKAFIRNISLIFIVWCLIQFILFSAKGFLIYPFVFIYFSLAIYMGKSNKNYYLLILGVILFLSIPFIGEYREALKADTNLNFETIVSNTLAGKDFFQIYFQSILSILSRVLGLGELIYMVELESASSMGFLDKLINFQSAENIMNQKIGFSGTGFAPSLLGQAYFSSGSIFGTALYILIWVVLSSLVLRALIKNSQNYTLRAVSILWVVNILFMSIDSTSFTKIMFFIITCVALWLIYSTMKFNFYISKNK